tara:strand:+ start:283 stop:1500 length:1218 start_codon:yes stop_codon:yes gene_type:complete
VANKIKNKFTFPKSTEFTPRDLIVDVKNGHLYYKSNYAVFRVSATIFSTNVDVTADTTIGTANDTEVLFNSNSIIDGLANFTVTALTDGSGNGTVNIGTVNIDGGTLDGISSLTAANSLDIGSHSFRALNLTADSLTPTTVVFAGANGLLSDNSDFTFTTSTNTLRVPKIGTFQAAGAIDFADHNMDNVDIDSGTIDDVNIGHGASSVVSIYGSHFRAVGNTPRYTSKPSSNLELTCDNKSFSNGNSGGAIKLFQDGNAGQLVHMKGGLYVMASGGFNGVIKSVGDVIAFASDKRLKENIVNIENPLQKIKQLRGVYFDWKDKTKKLGFIPSTMKNEIGMIAQEVEAVIPQAIETAPFDISYEGKDRENYKTIKYDRLIPLLIECVNEQQKQIDNLTNQIKQWQK